MIQIALGLGEFATMKQFMRRRKSLCVTRGDNGLSCNLKGRNGLTIHKFQKKAWHREGVSNNRVRHLRSY